MIILHPKFHIRPFSRGKFIRSAPEKAVLLAEKPSSPVIFPGQAEWKRSGQSDNESSLHKLILDGA
jgi:hypothetical protein